MPYVEWPEKTEWKQGRDSRLCPVTGQPIDTPIWVIQEDLFQENGRAVLIDTLEKMGIPFQVVKIVPFSHDLIPEITTTGNVTVNGSVLLSKIARERGWAPGGFLNDNFDYRVWHPYFKDYLLNSDAVFTTVAEAAPTWNDIFLRPVLDNKSFNGQVMSQEEFTEWKADVMAGDNSYVKPDTEIIYASPKNVGQEHRHFIVEGRVVTSSRYKLNGRPNQAAGADDYIVEFANKMAAIFSPSKAFVLDTYVTGDEIGIVELGCAANAGFYKADVQKYVMALEELNAK
jgi:hypothetical protein